VVGRVLVVRRVWEGVVGVIVRRMVAVMADGDQLDLILVVLEAVEVD
jgi:hypothetical protein